MDHGLLPYRSLETPTRATWENAYRSHRWNHLETLAELPRYSVLAGYVRRFGPARSILDFGCGSGLLLRSLHPSDFKTYLGIDIAASAIATAERFEDPGRVEFVVGDGPPEGTGQFHFVVCNETLYYLADPAGVLDQIAALLASDGYLLTSVWRHRGDRGLHRLISRRFAPLDSAYVETTAENERIRTRVSCWQPRSSV